MLVENSYVCLDSNIYIYRTLNMIEPKIFDDRLEKAATLIGEITNNNYSCKIVLLKTVIKEIINDSDDAYILFKEIQNFGVKKLRLHKNHFKLKQMERSALKSLKKFVSKYKYSFYFEDIEFTYNNMGEIKNFYLQYPQKLEKITQRKVSNIKDENAKQRKLRQRPNNLPEKSDLKIFNECLELNEQSENTFYILSNDSDFVEFSEEITNNFEINIFDFAQY